MNNSTRREIRAAKEQLEAAHALLEWAAKVLPPKPLPTLQPAPKLPKGHGLRERELPLYCTDGTPATTFYQLHGIVVKKQVRRYKVVHALLHGHSLQYNRHTQKHILTNTATGKIIATFADGGQLQIRI